MKTLRRLLFCLACFPVFYASGQNHVKLELKSEKEVTKEIKVGEYNDISLTLHFCYEADKKQYSILLENTNQDRVFWLASDPMMYADFKKKTRKVWESPNFKLENQTVYPYTQAPYLHKLKKDVVSILPGDTLRLKWEKISNDTAQKIESLTFYASKKESKGFLFGKKKQKMDQKIVVALSVRIPPKDPCFGVNAPDYEAFLQSKADELDKINKEIDRLSDSDRGKKAEQYKNRIQQIRAEIDGRKDTCKNKIIIEKIAHVDAEEKAAWEKLSKKTPQPPVTPGGTSSVDPKCTSCITEINNLKTDAKKIYLDIRNSRAKGQDVTPFKDKLDKLKQQAATIQTKNAQCKLDAALKNFTLEHDAAMNELKKSKK